MTGLLMWAYPAQKNNQLRYELANFGDLPSVMALYLGNQNPISHHALVITYTNPPPARPMCQRRVLLRRRQDYQARAGYW